MIVVDTNVIAFLLLSGPFTGAAEALLARDDDWRAPVLWRSEFRNMIGGYARRGAMSWDQAKLVQRRAEAFLHDASFEVDSAQVLQLARDSDCSSYECEFVALAMQFGAELVTMDRKLLRAFPRRAVPLSA